jgi:hypothetical protein
MIDPAVEFRRQAVLCRRMAREALDLESRGGWNRLADRWTRCAELEEARPSADTPDTDTTRGRFIGTLPNPEAASVGDARAGSLKRSPAERRRGPKPSRGSARRLPAVASCSCPTMAKPGPGCA